VRNCSLYNASGTAGRYYRNSGICLDNTINGVLNNVTAYNNGKGSGMFGSAGIWLERTDRTRVVDCHGHSNFAAGLLGSSSGNLTITDSHFDKNGQTNIGVFGLILMASDNVTVESTTASLNKDNQLGYGFAAVGSKDVKVANSTFNDNGHLGIGGMGR